jgi:putative endonuclease
MTAAPWFLYMVRTASGQLYTGISTDPHRRLRQHSGELVGGAKALRGKGPLQLVFQQAMPNRVEASKAEYQLKQLSKAAKEQRISEPRDG